MPRLAVRHPSWNRFWSGLGGGGGVRTDSARADSARVESGAGGLGCCAPSVLAATPHNTTRQRVFALFGPRMDAPPADPYEGTLLYDEPGVRAYLFAHRVHAIAHFLRATQGIGAVVAMLSRRAPELRHIRRWMQVLFSEPFGGVGSTQLLAGWVATGGAGVLFVPPPPHGPYSYPERGLDL